MAHSQVAGLPRLDVVNEGDFDHKCGGGAVLEKGADRP